MCVSLVLETWFVTFTFFHLLNCKALSCLFVYTLPVSLWKRFSAVLKFAWLLIVITWNRAHQARVKYCVQCLPAWNKTVNWTRDKLLFAFVVWLPVQLSKLIMALYISRKDSVHTITIHGRKVAHPTLPKVQTHNTNWTWKVIQVYVREAGRRLSHSYPGLYPEKLPSTSWHRW